MATEHVQSNTVETLDLCQASPERKCRLGDQGQLPADVDLEVRVRTVFELAEMA